MKIILINPYFILYKTFYGYMEDIGSILPPLGLLSIASYLKANDYNVQIIDGWVENLNLKDLVDKIEKKNPQIIGMYINTSSFYYAKEIISEIRRRNENAIIITGGPHSTAIPKKTMEQIPGIDILVKGEGEYKLLKILKSINKKNNQILLSNTKSNHLFNHELEKIPGILYRKYPNGNIHITKDTSVCVDLDQLPLTEWNLLDMKKYKPSDANYLSLPSYTLLTSRGCPYNCSFCGKSLGSNVRFKSPKKVFEEVKHLVDDYGAKEIIFEDDCFTLSHKRLFEIFKLFKNNKIEIKWSCLARIDNINKKLLQSMKSNNCWRIGYGVESGNSDILKKINKNFTKKNGY